MQIDSNMTSILPTLLESGGGKSNFEQLSSKLQGLSQSDSFNISGFGQIAQLRSEVSGLSEEGKAELQSFHQEVFKSIQDGSFDAKSLAESAPEEFKALAEEKGIDIENVLSQVNEKVQEAKNLFASDSYGLNVSNFGLEGLSQNTSSSGSQDPTQTILDILFSSQEDSEDEELVSNS